MTAGLAVYNDNNQLVIDEKYINLALLRKIKYTDLPYANGADNPFRLLTLNPGEVLFAFSLEEDKNFCLYPYKIGEKQWCIFQPNSTSLGSGGNYPITDADLANVYIYIFGFDNQTSPDGCGLVVYDTQGKICYDSGKKYMRVVKYVYGAVANGVVQIPPDDASYRPPTIWNKKYALVYTGIVLTSDTWFAGFENPEANGAFVGGVRMTYWHYNTLKEEEVKVFTYYPNINSHNTYSGSTMNHYGYMILDVTNY